MSWRDPRPRGEWVDATCDNLRELAFAYHPVLRWTEGEEVFPALAEAWLSHTTSAPWTDAEAEEDDVWAHTVANRGTAIVRGGPDLTEIQRLGGPPNAGDRPIQLSSDPTDPDAIGNPAYAGADDRIFLDFGGWGFARQSGDELYLRDAFSELSAAMQGKPRIEWQPIHLRSNLPQFWIPQPINPTVYAEAEWAGMYPRWCAQYGQSDFPPLAENRSDIDNFLCLTYYYLYPQRQPIPGGAFGPRRLEGQWEAISLFFDAKPGNLGIDGRPTTLVFHEPPPFVVASQGFERSLGKHANEFRPWDEVEKTHAHPVLYVGGGTHRNFFAPQTGTVWDPDQPRPGDVGDIAGSDEIPGMEELMGIAIALGTVAFGLLLGGLVVAAAVLAAIALFFLLLWLISFLWDMSNQDTGDPVPDWGGSEEGGGDGPQGGDGDEPPAGGSGGPDPTSQDAPPGTTNVGSPTGRDVVSFDVRFVDMLHEADVRTGFPSERPCEHPHWWDFTGSWGIHVPPSVNGGWESGIQRVDGQRRSWGYFHALRVMTVLAGGSRGP